MIEPTYLVEITPADTIANDDGDGRRVVVLHRCGPCQLQRRWTLPPGRWQLGHAHDGTWVIHRAGRLLVAC